jgi:hypothetical protein
MSSSPPLPIAAGTGPFQIKGSIYQGLVAAARHVGVEQAFTAPLEPATRAFASQIFLSSGWYDAFPVVPLTEALAKQVGLSFAQVVRRGAKRRVTEDLETVYRIELKRSSPAELAPRLARGFDRYFAFGRAEIAESTSYAARAKMFGVPEYVAVWYKLSTATFFEVVLALAGATHVEVDWAEEADTAVGGHRTRRFECGISWK